MPLTQIQINSLKSLFEPMDKPELDEALDMLIDEALKRKWEDDITTVSHKSLALRHVGESTSTQ